MSHAARRLPVMADAPSPRFSELSREGEASGDVTGRAARKQTVKLCNEVMVRHLIGEKVSHFSKGKGAEKDPLIIRLFSG